jgi:hypothetical protein
MPVERTLMAPPRSRIGAITPEERAAVRGRSPVGVKYDTAVNRESAYELLTKRAAEGPAPTTMETSPARRDPASPTATAPESKTDLGSRLNEWLWGTKRRQGMVETMAKQTARTIGSQLGRQVLRGVLGGISGSSRRR